MGLQAPIRKTLSERVMNEPLSQATEVKRRNLLYAASIAVLLTVYDLKITKTPWVDVHVPDSAPNVLQGALAVALIYVFIVFLFYVVADLRRWHHASELLGLGHCWNFVLEIHRHTFQLPQYFEKPPESHETQKKRDSAQKGYDETTKFIDGMQNELRRLNRKQSVLGGIQWLRLVVFDVGAPLLLGGFAIVKISPSLLPFLSVVVK